MITLIIKSYFVIFLSIGLVSLCFFAAGLYFIFRTEAKGSSKILREAMNEDYTAIAGDDVLTTQLDLARAYIETGRTQLAKNILESVAKQGSVVQQKEAQRLLVSVLSG